MLKMIGSILIILATTWAGFESSKHLSERPRQLRLLRTALRALDAEIMYGHTPLHEAAQKLGAQIPNPLSWFFTSFSKKLCKSNTTVKKSWDESLQEAWHLTAFNKTDREILMQFGNTLGKHDRLTQQKQIQLTLTHIEREETEARDKQQRYEKMLKSLGVLSGFLLVILLL